MSVSRELRAGCSQVDVGQCQTQTGLVEFCVADGAVAIGTCTERMASSVVMQRDRCPRIVV